MSDALAENDPVWTEACRRTAAGQIPDAAWGAGPDAGDIRAIVRGKSMQILLHDRPPQITCSAHLAVNATLPSVSHHCDDHLIDASIKRGAYIHNRTLRKRRLPREELRRK
jgi:hypothetical protein